MLNIFSGCTNLSSVVIGNNVISINDAAFFGCSSLTSVIIPNSVTSIGNQSFERCISLTELSLGNSVETIGGIAFEGCSGLTSVKIPESVKDIRHGAFAGCSGLTSITIPNSLNTIGEGIFGNCSGLTSIIIPNSVTTISGGAFYGCSGLTSITIPNSVTSIGVSAFQGCSALTSVVSLIEEPFVIDGKVSETGTFDLDIFNNVTLYVPVGTIDKYKSTEGWKDFLFIEEGTGPSGGGDTPTVQKCAKPTISYQKGKLTFNSDTEGATCQSTITDSDIASFSSNEVQLGVTYNISVYASKAGYENSDVATATLCWIDVEPKTEGITNSVTNVRALAVLILSNGNQLTISGAEEGTIIKVFDIAGRPAGSVKVSAKTTTINTSLRNGEIGIVKIGDKAVKVLIK